MYAYRVPSQEAFCTQTADLHNPLKYDRNTPMAYNIDKFRPRGLTMEDLADRVGVSRGFLQDVKAGRKEPSPKVLRALAHELNCTVSDLLGEASIISDSAPLAPYEAGHPARVNISVYDVRAAAGRNLVQLEQDIIIDDLTFKLAWLRRRTSAALDKLAVIKVWGDSMEPSLSDGDDILIDMTQTEAGGGGVFLIRDDGSLLIKRLQKVGTRLKVISDNPAYVPYESDEVEVLGRMIWQGRNW